MQMTRPVRWLLVLLLLAVATVAGAPATTQARSAEVQVLVDARPNYMVARGDQQVYRIETNNRGGVRVSSAELVVRYDPNVMTIEDTLFDQIDDQVIEFAAGEMTIRLRSISPRSMRPFALFFRVKPDVPDMTVIPMQVTYKWRDTEGNGRGEQLSNSAPVLVGSVTEARPDVWVAVSPPAAQAGELFSFFSDRFVPEERVNATLVYPDGTREALGGRYRQTVGGDGRVWVHLERGNLLPGDYQMILRGDRSALEGAASFTVLP